MITKESIEIKLGMTIKEYMAKLDEVCNDGTETDWIGDPIHNLTEEEIEFLTEYINNNRLDKAS